jgi:hypothetical protein
MAKKKTTAKKQAVKARKGASKPKKTVAKKAKKVVKKTQAEKNVRKLQKQNNGSTTIALPTSILRELKWRDKQKVVVKKRGSTILIEDWKPKK